MNIMYRKLIKNVIINSLMNNGGEMSFEELMGTNLLLVPTELKVFLTELEKESVLLEKDNGCFMLKNTVSKDILKDKIALTNLDEFSRIFSGEFIPHMLDCQWFFTSKSCKDILSYLLSNSMFLDKKTIVFLGSPFLGFCASTLLKDCEIIIMDVDVYVLEVINKFKLNNVKTFHYDVQYPVEKKFYNTADIVFFDPPWYLNYYDIFIKRASFMLNEGGVLSFALFPLLLRPNSVSERLSINKIMIENGLLQFSLINNYIEYTIPNFEKNSDDTALENWRKGDLVMSMKVDKKNDAVSNVFFEIGNGNWKTFIFKNKIKIKLRIDDTHKYITPKILHIVSGDRLVSVSRRTININNIDFWTSTNVVLKIDGSGVIDVILNQICHNKGFNVNDIIKKYNIVLNSKEVSKIEYIYNFLLILLNKEVINA